MTASEKPSQIPIKSPKRTRGYELLRMWLVADCTLMLALGLFLLSMCATPDPAGDPFTSLFWKEGVTEGAKEFYAWSFGVWGATIMGWAATMFYIAMVPLKKRERWALICVAVSIAVWYPIDTIISLIFGVLLNCVLNTILLLLVLIPLLGMWREIMK